MARRRSRLAATFLGAFLFVVGASLATSLTALAQEAVETTDTGVSTTTDAVDTTQPTATEPAPAPAPEPTPTEPVQPSPAPEPGQDEPVPPDDSASPTGPPTSSWTPAAPHFVEGVPAPTGHHGPSHGPTYGASPEIESPWAYATIWLHRVLPDPTPPAERLSPAFADRLRAVSARDGVRWSLVLAVLRSNGHEGHVPAGRATLVHLAHRLARHDENVTIAVRALERYNRAVGLRALVVGLEAAKPALERRVLADRRIDLYSAARADLSSGRIDVRVVVLIRYLVVSFGQVTVSSLRTGHRFYARPGVVSAHVYGLAVDVAAVGGSPISGHQGPGSITERAVEAILLLPAELQPQQVISLLGLGGPSFALGDHYDHIHVGF
jgi:hypothetical protein